MKNEKIGMRSRYTTRAVFFAAVCLGFPVLLLFAVEKPKPTATQSPSNQSPADQSPSNQPTAFELNRRLGRGVNILGYDPIWKDAAKARFQPEFFKLIHDAGFDHVRINLHPFRDADANGEPSEQYWKTLDAAVQQALANRLAVVLDFHEFQAMAKNPADKKERFLAFWKQLGERYKNASDDVFFEILNEPNGDLTPKLWNEYLRDALAVIRETNPTRAVIVGPGRWNNLDALEELELPAEDRHLIVAVHYYNPFDFTHQGAPWAGKKDKIGVAWHGSENERQAILHDFRIVRDWSKQQNRPIYLGEFGVYDKAEMPSRTRYLNFVARQAEKLGWSWAYWQFDSDFILYDVPKRQWNQPVLDALQPKKH